MCWRQSASLSQPSLHSSQANGQPLRSIVEMPLWVAGADSDKMDTVGVLLVARLVALFARDVDEGGRLDEDHRVGDAGRGEDHLAAPHGAEALVFAGAFLQPPVVDHLASDYVAEMPVGPVVVIRPHLARESG